MECSEEVALITAQALSAAYSGGIELQTNEDYVAWFDNGTRML